MKTPDDVTNEAVRAYVQAGKRGEGLFGAMKCAIEAAIEADRKASIASLEVVLLMAINGNYSGQEEAVQELYI